MCMYLHQVDLCPLMMYRAVQAQLPSAAFACDVSKEAVLCSQSTHGHYSESIHPVLAGTETSGR